MRSINELIWHCSATPAGRATSIEDVDNWHRARGFKRTDAARLKNRRDLTSVGYHVLVLLDGSVELGRDFEEVGAHVSGHNANTLGFCYVGGVDKDTLKPKDTRTAAQKRTMLRLTREAIAQFPTIKRVSGHREHANKACPSFNAKAEYAHLLKAAK